MEATVRRTPAPSQFLRFALAILAAVALWRLTPVAPQTAVLLAIAVLFLIGIKRPIWAMAAFLVSQFTITSYMVATPIGPPISLRLLLILLIAFLVWRAWLHGRVTLGPGARRVIVPATILMGISLVANLVNSGLDYAFKDFRQMLVGLLVIILIPALVRSLKDLKILCAVVFVTLTVSAAVGITQYFNVMGMSEQSLLPGMMGRFDDYVRVPGIAEVALDLSYALSAAVAVMLGVWLSRGLKGGARLLLVPSMGMLAVALYFTYTRSALLAAIVAVGAVVVLLRTRVRLELMLVVVLIGLVAIEVTGVMEGQTLGGRSESAQVESAQGRKVLWQAGLAIAIDNPVLGIGGDQFRTVSMAYASRVDPSLMAREEQFWSYRTLGSLQPHNDFLAMPIRYGGLAFGAYFWLYFAMLRNFHEVYRASRGRFLKGLSMGLAAAVMAYVVNAFYHNLMASTSLFWILAGFSVVVAKLAAQRNGHRRRAGNSAVNGHTG